MDPSLKPDADRKGSYYRRLEDIERVLQSPSISGLSAEIRFFPLYFGCEKVARALLGIHAVRPAAAAFKPGASIKLTAVKAVAAGLGLPVAPADLDWLFADHNEQTLLTPRTIEVRSSARVLRNDLTHDFGPTHFALVGQHAPFLNPKMETLLHCIPGILAHLRANFSHIP